ncbi:MAG: hypothetical protein A2Z04_05525 [Chloroflexi bacterium RBG_16_57_9]|nr:MAG: hypothetical protein A2Z04_05525 [Chloroflexi bacterium RBG_16_57_9]
MITLRVARYEPPSDGASHPFPESEKQAFHWKRLILQRLQAFGIPARSSIQQPDCVLLPNPVSESRLSEALGDLAAYVEPIQPVEQESSNGAGDFTGGALPNLANAQLVPWNPQPTDTEAYLDILEANLRREAIRRLESDPDRQWSEFSTSEREALIYDCMLEIVSNELEYLTTRLKARLISQIEKRQLWAYHPGGFNSLVELLGRRGIRISKSEASDLRFLYEKLSPWVKEQLTLTPEELWREAGLANLRMIVPKARRALAAADVAALQNLIEQAMNHDWEGLRRALKTSRHQFNVTVYHEGERFRIETDWMSAEQFKIVKRALRHHWEPQFVGETSSSEPSNALA